MIAGFGQKQKHLVFLGGAGPRERKSVSGRHPLIGEPGAGLARDLSRNQESDAQPTEPPEWDP